MATPDVVTRIAAGLDERLDGLLRRTCDLARALTGAEQAALKIDLAGDGSAVRKLFSLSPRYERWRGYRVDPRGLGLHGITLARGQVVRLTQADVESHPAWTAFGDQAGVHPPLRGWLAVPIHGDDGRNHGLLQLSDKAGGADFSAQDGERVLELAEFAGAMLDALRRPG
jgi:GAF domain-containing protein